MDVWALGVVLAQLCTLQPVTMALLTEDAVRALLDAVRAAHGVELARLVALMLTRDAARRATARTMLRQPGIAPVAAAAAASVTPSVKQAFAEVTAAPWMRMAQLQGLPWGQAEGATHLKVCRVSATDHTVAIRALWGMIASAGGDNARLQQRYEILSAVLLRDSHRALQFTNRVRDLDTKYAGLHGAAAHPFAIDMSTVSHRPWRKAIARHFEQNFAPLSGGDAPGSVARVHLAFHVAPSEAVATKILEGNFAILAELDPGFFGQARALVPLRLRPLPPSPQRTHSINTTTAQCQHLNCRALCVPCAGYLLHAGCNLRHPGVRRGLPRPREGFALGFHRQEPLVCMSV